MAVRPIVKYPAEVLTAGTRPVERFDGELQTLIDDMVQTMYAAPGVGLAAPQVGIPLRLAVVDVTVGQEPGALLVLVNPEIVAMEGEQEVEEGCLSIPGYGELVPRAAEVELRALDAEGREWTRRADGLLARAFQHECDHLDGRLYVDRLGPLKRTLMVRRIKKRIRAGDW